MRGVTEVDKHSLALLGSFCLFLSAVEYLIPKPLPFMRLGLANLPLLLALDIYSLPKLFILALVKVLGQGIISGTLFSYIFLFSIAGTFTSVTVMYIIRFALGKKHLGFSGLGICGALSSNGVQLFLAQYLIFGTALRFLIPPFLLAGLVTGFALGILCEYFCSRSVWYKNHTQKKDLQNNSDLQNIEYKPFEPVDSEYTRKKFFHMHNNTLQKFLEKQRSKRSLIWDSRFNAIELFIAALIMTVIFLVNSRVEIRIAHSILFCFFAFAAGKKNNFIATFIIIISIIFFHILAPHGRIIAVIGPLRITWGSLVLAAEKAATLIGLIMLSRACIKKDLKLPGLIGFILARSFNMFFFMREKKTFIKKGAVIEGIDALLFELEKEARKFDNPISESSTTQEKQFAGKKRAKSRFLLVLMILAVLSLSMIGYFLL
jgi:heptaprenyl diphosphate synthase